MKKGIIALLACVFALSLALVGCSGGGGGDVKSAWIGTWDLVEMEESGHPVTADDIQMLKDLGLTVSFDANEDGSAKLSFLGEVVEGKWEAKSATEGTFTVEDQAIDMKITDGKLAFEQNGSKLVFQKGEAASGSAASASASSASSSASS